MKRSPSPHQVAGLSSLVQRCLYIYALLASTALTLVLLVSGASAQTQTFTTLYTFSDFNDGGLPDAAVVQDPAGNLYGTTQEGGVGGYGVVFEVDTAGKETVLHSFAPPPDGSWPTTPVVRDSGGNIYGTTNIGGSRRCDYSGCGVVFMLDKTGMETILYTFGNASDGSGGLDGCFPGQGLVRDNDGNLYGTTNGNCKGSRYGTIFKVDSAGNFTLLHTFTGSVRRCLPAGRTSDDGQIGQLLWCDLGGWRLQRGSAVQAE
jgi:uncharacterized repeat protein (TIGR03803 family)